jgi:hypothetical protein
MEMAPKVRLAITLMARPKA